MSQSSLESDRLARSFAASLLQALGLAAVAAAGVTGCGANVVFGEPGEEGGGGSTSDGGGGFGAGVPTGGGGDGQGGSVVVTCDEPPPEGTLTYACFFKDNGVCPAADSEATYSQLADQLEWDYCDEFCCDSQWISGPPCGPDPAAPSECCYWVPINYESSCMGRPFTVEGTARTAGLTGRDDWASASACGGEAASLDAKARAFLAQAYAGSALMEHASVASFARFILDLLSMGAPASLVRDAQRALADEIRHAELSFGLAARYAGHPVGPTALDVDDAPAGRRDPARVLADTVREGCVGETVAALLAARAAEVAVDPEVKAALTEIAADEARHAELAWRTVAWALGAGDPALRSAIEEAFATATATAPSAPCADGVDWTVLRAHGQLDAAESRAVVESALRDVVGACRRALTTPAPATISTAASAC